MSTIHLANGFRLHADTIIPAFHLEHPSALISYALQNPKGFASLEVWIAYVERTANAHPGTFHASIVNSSLAGEIYGQHRQAYTSLHSYPAQSSYTSAGVSNPYTQQAIHNAYQNGTITSAEAHAYLIAIAQQSQSMAHPAAAPPNYLGYGFSGTLPAPRKSPHEPTTLKSDGMRAGEIIAWRAWLIRGNELHSVVAGNGPWDATEPMHGDPATGYGVHAYKGPHGPLLDDYVSKSSTNQWVIGEVELWGDVIEHEDGYRAEFARVHSFVTWSDNTSQQIRAEITRRYLSAQEYKIDDAA